MNDQLYREEILEHYRHPQNFGKLKKPTFSAHKLNPLCGDEITLQILLDKNSKVKDVKFQGSGCALSIASASLFTETLKGQPIGALKKIKPDSVIKLLGIKPGPARQKCVLLIYNAVQEMLKNHV